VWGLKGGDIHGERGGKPEQKEKAGSKLLFFMCVAIPLGKTIHNALTLACGKVRKRRREPQE